MDILSLFIGAVVIWFLSPFLPESPLSKGKKTSKGPKIPPWRCYKCELETGEPGEELDTVSCPLCGTSRGTSNTARSEDAADGLREQRSKVAALKKAAQADGVVTVREKAAIEAAEADLVAAKPAVPAPAIAAGLDAAAIQRMVADAVAAAFVAQQAPAPTPTPTTTPKP